MSIRIGSSCALSISMALGYVVETRILTDNSSDWQNVCKHAINNKQCLILTVCINNGYNIASIPDDITWQNTIRMACQYLKSIGGSKYNCRLSLVNEPMKWIDREHYTRLINLATPIIHSYGFLVGAGNEEFVMASAHGNMYQYILDNANFDILDIHIQGSCDTQAHIDKYYNEVKSWIAYWKKPVDCTEAFYGNITASSGWNLLKAQLDMAEKLECANFCNVFNNLETSYFPVLSDPKVRDKWYELCFKINGNLHSNYWGQWLSLMEAKKPVPNIIEIEELDDMKLTVLKPGSKGNQVLWLQEILEEEYKFENAGSYDGIYGSMTLQQVKAYQTANNLEPDGFVGKFTMADLISKSENPNYWMNKLQVYMAYE